MIRIAHVTRAKLLRANQLRTRLHEAAPPRSDALSDWGMKEAGRRASDFLDENPPPYDPDEVGKYAARFLTDVPERDVIAYVKQYLAYYRGIPGSGANRSGRLR